MVDERNPLVEEGTGFARMLYEKLSMNELLTRSEMQQLAENWCAYMDKIEALSEQTFVAETAHRVLHLPRQFKVLEGGRGVGVWR